MFFFFRQPFALLLMMYCLKYLENPSSYHHFLSLSTSPCLSPPLPPIPLRNSLSLPTSPIPPYSSPPLPIPPPLSLFHPPLPIAPHHSLSFPTSSYAPHISLLIPTASYYNRFLILHTASQHCPALVPIILRPCFVLRITPYPSISLSTAPYHSKRLPLPVQRLPLLQLASYYSPSLAILADCTLLLPIDCYHSHHSITLHRILSLFFFQHSQHSPPHPITYPRLITTYSCSLVSALCGLVAGAMNLRNRVRRRENELIEWRR